MSGSKGMGIKLFGKTIPLAPKQQEQVSFAVKSCSGPAAATACIGCYDHRNTSAIPENQAPKEQEKQEEKRETLTKEINDDEQEKTTTNRIIGNSKDPTSSDENQRTLSAEREISSPESPPDEEASQKSASQVKTLKKPDKILACPRCNSMETKFCYYNNYNVNQPRHFCKSCQRYWTAGGTMRNVPVGAGRRKNKTSSVSHYNNIMVREALRTAQILAMDGAQSVSLGNYSSVLTFGSDFPLSEYGSSLLNLSDSVQNSMGNKLNATRQIIVDPCGGSADNGDDRSSGSSITAASTASDKAGNGCLTRNFQGFPCNNLSWFLGPPLSYPWSSAMATPAFCPSSFPVSFYPESNCRTCTVPSPWNLKTCLSPSSSSVSHSIQIPSPTSALGKHSRDGNLLNPELKKGENNSETCSLAPKRLRIDDPIEAAKCSLWETTRTKGENTHSFNGIGLFEGFKSKIEGRNYMTGTSSSVLQSNPAAMSRSLNFHETT